MSEPLISGFRRRARQSEALREAMREALREAPGRAPREAIREATLIIRVKVRPAGSGSRGRLSGSHAGDHRGKGDFTPVSSDQCSGSGGRDFSPPVCPEGLRAGPGFGGRLLCPSWCGSLEQPVTLRGLWEGDFSLPQPPRLLPCCQRRAVVLNRSAVKRAPSSDGARFMFVSSGAGCRPRGDGAVSHLSGVCGCLSGGVGWTRRPRKGTRRAQERHRGGWV